MSNLSDQNDAGIVEGQVEESKIVEGSPANEKDIEEFERKRRTEQAELKREEFHENEKTRQEKEAEEEQ